MIAADGRFGAHPANPTEYSGSPQRSHLAASDTGLPRLHSEAVLTAYPFLNELVPEHPSNIETV